MMSFWEESRVWLVSCISRICIRLKSCKTHLFSNPMAHQFLLNFVGPTMMEPLSSEAFHTNRSSNISVARTSMEAYGNRGVSTNSKQSVNIVWRPLTTGHVVAICRKHIQKFHLVARIWHVSRNQDKHVNIIGLVIHPMIFPKKIAMSVSEWMIKSHKIWTFIW